jgi:methyl-accepting chemotaxis protein
MAKQLGLRARLLAFVLVPCLLMGALMAERALDKRTAARETDDLSLLVRLAVIVGDLLHETQKERGSSSVFMSSHGTKFVNELQAQRTATDERRLKYLQFVRANDARWPAAVAAALRLTDPQLDEIEARRRQVTDLSAPIPELIGYYNELNRRLLESVGSIASKSGDTDLRAWSTGYFAFLQAKESTGQERAQLSNVFGADRFAPGQYFTVASLLSAQRSYLHIFSITAPPEAVQLFRQKAEMAVFAEVAAKEQVAFGNGPPALPAAGFGVDSADWFKVMTRKIDLLKEVEIAAANAILARADRLQDAATVAFRQTLVLGLALLLIVLGGAAVVAHRIVDPIRRLTAVADRVCAGELDHEIDTGAPAELGALAASFSRMVLVLKTMRGTPRRVVPGRMSGSRAVMP